MHQHRMLDKEDNNQATFSINQHVLQSNKNPMLLKTPMLNNSLTTLEKDSLKEVPEELLPLEESSRLLMTTDLNLLMLLSSRNACMISELE